MYSEWTAHLQDREDKERFENQIRSARPVLERLDQIMGNRLQSLLASERKETDFDTPSWSHKQAFRNGFISCLNIYCKYLEIDPRKERQNELPIRPQ
jgi:hypothetical protein